MFNLEDYETVEDRLIKFWKDYADGRISTEIVEHTLQRFIIKASIYRTEVDAHPWSTGFAEETVSTRGVNSTSALENCETSAIGRALANAGYASKGKRPSREEMAKVKSAEPRPFTEKLAEKITTQVEDDPWTVKAVSPAPSAAEAVALVQEVLGATKIDKDIPHCKHGERIWKTGNKNGRAWANMACSGQPARQETWAEFNKCDPIWYVIDNNGAWKPQEARS
ncbi:hypothetical protein UFOVP539_9 [uncultured Caudovirales phage]|uniref:Uncharacterized protein n=1 Tax=uncultured Caudovirales phage TaxID=2100421 RepID=A0A6J5MVU5_9CAUD|nr:hypothetical protein UFOVP539_9 [uncultured Caudovirales phage]